MRVIRVTSLVLIAAFSFLSIQPSESSVEPSTLQAIYLAYPQSPRPTPAGPKAYRKQA